MNSTRGKILASGDFQVRKRLVVLQILIKSRLHVLDQPGLDEHGVDFALGFQKVDIRDLAHQVGCAAIFGSSFEKVACGAGPQAFGLSHVNHASRGVLHQIYAGRLRKLSHFGRGAERALEPHRRMRAAPREQDRQQACLVRRTSVQLDTAPALREGGR